MQLHCNAPSLAPATVRMHAREGLSFTAFTREAVCMLTPRESNEMLGGEKKTTIFPLCRTPLLRRHRSRKKTWRPRSPAPALPPLDSRLQARIREHEREHERVSNSRAGAHTHTRTAPLTFTIIFFARLRAMHMRVRCVHRPSSVAGTLQSPRLAAAQGTREDGRGGFFCVQFPS